MAGTLASVMKLVDAKGRERKVSLAVTIAHARRPSARRHPFRLLLVVTANY